MYFLWFRMIDYGKQWKKKASANMPLLKPLTSVPRRSRDLNETRASALIQSKPFAKFFNAMYKTSCTILMMTIRNPSRRSQLGFVICSRWYVYDFLTLNTFHLRHRRRSGRVRSFCFCCKHEAAAMPPWSARLPFAWSKAHLFFGYNFRFSWDEVPLHFSCTARCAPWKKTLAEPTTPTKRNSRLARKGICFATLLFFC